MSEHKPSSHAAATDVRPDGRRLLMVARGLDSIGTGRQIELAAEAFQAAGWEVHLAVTTAGGAVATRLTQAGMTVHQLSTRPVVDVAAAVGADGSHTGPMTSRRP